MVLDRVPLWRGDHVSVRQLADDFARYHYLPRLAGTDVLVEAVRNGLGLTLWNSRASPTRTVRRGGRPVSRAAHGQLVNVSENDLSGLLVRPEAALAQVDREHPVPPPEPRG